MQTVFLFTLARRRHIHDLFDLRRPAPKMIEAGRRADDANSYFLGLLGTPVRPVEKQAILGMRRGLVKGEFERRLEEMQRLQ
jgi:hypothetical protein